MKNPVSSSRLGGAETGWGRENWERQLGGKGEGDLYKTLFEKYNQIIRPVNNANESVVIAFELFIAQLVKVDEVRVYFAVLLILNLNSVRLIRLWKLSYGSSNPGLTITKGSILF